MLIHVSVNGLDSPDRDGLTPEAAFRSIQYALSNRTGALEIHLGPGEYDGFSDARSDVVTIQGQPGAIIKPSAECETLASLPIRCRIEGVEFNGASLANFLLDLSARNDSETDCPEFTRCVFTGAKQKVLFCEGNAVNTTEAVRFIDCDFSDCAEGYLLLDQAGAYLEGCRMQGDSHEWDCIRLMNGRSAPFRMYRCLVYGRKRDRAGIVFDGLSPDHVIEIDQCTFYGLRNAVESSLTDDSRPVITRSIIDNCEFVTLSTWGPEGDYTHFNRMVVALNQVCISRTSYADAEGAKTLVEPVNCITADARLVNPDAGDYRPSVASPCKEWGAFAYSPPASFRRALYQALDAKKDVLGIEKIIDGGNTDEFLQSESTSVYKENALVLGTLNVSRALASPTYHKSRYSIDLLLFAKTKEQKESLDEVTSGIISVLNRETLELDLIDAGIVSDSTGEKVGNESEYRLLEYSATRFEKIS